MAGALVLIPAAEAGDPYEPSDGLHPSGGFPFYEAHLIAIPKFVNPKIWWGNRSTISVFVGHLLAILGAEPGQICQVVAHRI